MSKFAVMVWVAVTFMASGPEGISSDRKVDGLAFIVDHSKPFGGFDDPVGPALPEDDHQGALVSVGNVQWDISHAILNIPGGEGVSIEELFWWKWYWAREQYIEVWVDLDFRDGEVHTATFSLKLEDPLVINRTTQQKEAREPTK
jgi:hypothetical protein